MQSAMAMIGAIVLAVIFAVIGVLYLANHHTKHGLLFIGLAVVAGVAASFLRPKPAV